MRSNVKQIMKTKILPYFALCVAITVLSSGCQKTDSGLASENADLKARVQQLEEQLHASQGQAASVQSQAASAGDLQSQLAEAQKKADTATDELKSLSSQTDGLKQKIDELTRQLTEAQQARQRAEQALLLFQDKASSALKQFQALRSTLGSSTAGIDRYHQNYLATQSAVNSSLAALPDSRIRRQIAGVLAQFTQIDNIWQTADRQMQARTREAQAAYDKFVDLGGLGPVDRLVELGQAQILAPVKKENVATAANRDRQMAASEKNLDLAIQNLQALVKG